MGRKILMAAALAVIAGAVWSNAEALGLRSAWPLVVGFAFVPLAARSTDLGSITKGLGIGMIMGWAMFAVIASSLPFTPVVFGTAAGIVIGAIALISMTKPEKISSAAMYASFGVFVGLYEPAWIANRVAFLGEGASALATVAVTLFGAVIVSSVIQRASLVPSAAPSAQLVAIAGRRALVDRRAYPDRRISHQMSYAGPDRRVSERRRGADRRLRAATPAFHRIGA